MLWQTRSPSWIVDEPLPIAPPPRISSPRRMVPAARRVISPPQRALSTPRDEVSPSRHVVAPPQQMVPQNPRRPYFAYYDEEEVGAEFLHAWEAKDVERWLYSEGLDEVVHAFRSAKLRGEDLLDMNPNNAGDKLKDVDSAAVMRVCAALMPLKHIWKHTRQAAGLKTNVKPVKPAQLTKLVADLNVLIDGASHLPPGASGAYVDIELVCSDFRNNQQVKSGFLPAPPPTYFEAGRAAYSSWPVVESQHPHLASFCLPHEPQAFRISVDEKSKKDMEKIKICVVAWLPNKGELEVGRVEMPLPDAKNGAVQVIRLDKPVRAELQWVSYHSSVSKKADDWQAVAEPDDPRIAPLEGAWYTPYDDYYLYGAADPLYHHRWW